MKGFPSIGIARTRQPAKLATRRRRLMISYPGDSDADLYGPLQSLAPEFWQIVHEKFSPGLETSAHPDGPILFCPSNDTHSKMFFPILPHAGEYRFLLPDIRPGENAEETLREKGIEPMVGAEEKLAVIKPSIIVVGNDWNKTMIRFLRAARRLGIPSACIQEGCLDFDTQNRMQECDFPLIQGPIMPAYLDRSHYVLTGNPRFDEIAEEPPPPRPLVMINCNFTYGVHEDQRDSWVGDVVAACREVGLDFFISQHPRDKGTFPGLPVRKSGARVVHGQLRESSILVTRFSTLIYEALYMGRDCIYHNPFGEKMRLFNEDATGGIGKAVDRAQLIAALRDLTTAADAARAEKRQRFLSLHCGPTDRRAGERCAMALRWLASAPPVRRRNKLLSMLGL